MFYLLTGLDDFSLRESLEKMKRDILDPALIEANTTILDGRKITIDQLRPIIETIPFISEKRMIIIDGLIERFEPNSKNIGKRKHKENTVLQTTYQLLAEYIKQIPESSVLVFVDREITDNNPFLKKIRNSIEIKSFPLLKGIKLEQWIKKRVINEGGRISPQAVGLLARMIGSDLWVMSSEINKLVLFTEGRCIESADVNDLVSSSQQANIFALIDTILRSQAGVAEQILQRLLRNGVGVNYILGMLSRQIRLIILTRIMREQKKSNKEIQKKLGIVAEFAFSKTMEQAVRYSVERLKKVYNQILEADLSIKTGKYDNELALDILIVTLCQI